MPDGQIFSRSLSPTSCVKVHAQGTPKPPPLSQATWQVANKRLLAVNATLKAVLTLQRAKAAQMQSILGSLGVPVLCVGQTQKLSVFTASAGHLLGIGPDDLGNSLSLSASFCHQRTLNLRIKAVLETGVAENQVVVLANGKQIFCRLMPLVASETNKAVNGVILTFDPIPLEPCEDGGARKVQYRNDGIASSYTNLAYGLTQRQHEVLGYVLAGQPSKNIAADLGISRRTVENHRAAIMARTGATSLPALARLAIGADVSGDRRALSSRRVYD
jgi:DNA-binding CsgD family transcriptional regulator